MANEIKVDYSGMRKAFDRYQNATKKNMQKVIDYWSRPLVRQLVMYTAPTTKTPDNDTLNAQRRAGEGAIASDYAKIFTPILQSTFVTKPKNPKLAEQIRTLAEKNATKKIQDLFIRAGINALVLDRVTAEYHRRSLDAHNRARDNVNALVVKKAGSVKLLRDLQRRVGVAKSGWVRAAAMVNLHLPGWITRHNGKGGARKVQTFFEIKYVFNNRVSYISRLNLETRIIQRAVNRIAEKMNNAIDKILGQQFKGYGKSGKYAKVTK